MSRHIALLGEIAQVNPPLPFSPEATTPVAFVPMAAVSTLGTVLTADTRHFGEVAKGYTPFLSGDLLIAKITPCFENGKIAHATISQPVGVGSTEFHVVRPNREAVDPRYLLHYLRQPHVREAGARKMTGSAGQRRVPEHFVRELRIFLPSLPEQRRIAVILDKAEALRELRASASKQLESLPRGLLIDALRSDTQDVELGNAVEAIIDYRGKSPSKTSSGVPLITARVVKGGYILPGTEFIAEASYEAWMRRGLPQAGDVLFTTEAPLGETAQVDNPKIALAQRLLLLRGKAGLLDNTFLRFLLTTPEVVSQVQQRATGTTVRGIRQSELRKVVLPLPRFDIQRLFAKRVKAIERLRRVNISATLQLQILAASLRQRAFEGKL